MPHEMPREKLRLARLRAHQRFPTRFDAMIEYDRGSLTIRVADISARGARLCFVDRIPGPIVGKRIKLLVINLAVEARVVWQSAQECGIVLDTPIAPLTVVRGNYLPLQHLRSQYVAACPSADACQICGLPPRSRCVVCQRGDVVVSHDYMAPDVS